MKTVSQDMLLKRIQRTGDGSHPSCKDMNNNENTVTPEMLLTLDHGSEDTMVWGWDDKDVSQEDRAACTIIGKKDE